MSIKKILLIGIGLLVAATVFAAGGKDQSGASTAETSAQMKQAVVNFWTWRPEDVEGYDKLIAIFESQNPGIKIVQTAHKNTEYNTILSAALSGGSGPDVFQSRAYGGLETFAQSGYMEPLETWVPELKDFSPASRRGASSIKDGKIYGVPFASQTLFVYFNQAMYTKLGLKVPQTWDQFLANLQAMKAAGIQPLANGGKDGWTLEVLLGAIAPNFYGANDFFDAVVKGQTNFKDPRFVESIRKLGELKPFMPDLFMGTSYTDMQSSFINEQAGHFIGGSFEAGYFSKQNPDLKFDFFPGPAAKAGAPNYVSTYADGNFSMNPTSANKEEVAKFLRFLAGKTTGDLFINEFKQVSSVPGVDTSRSPFIAKVLQVQQYNTPYVFLVGFRYQQPTGSVLAQAALQGMMAGKLSAEEVCQQIQEGIASYYEPFRK
ncbi:MAG: ABC transporter substrate-binding protein [Spirochaetes bacterium RIFOXYC1_FULL_54_7]|nr:MAG: ABC transporter substrate-binding protein [Spirochaetes bacterium RIFOXYC1_FULL_54_7]